jgi:hypothetical protein
MIEMDKRLKNLDNENRQLKQIISQQASAKAGSTDLTEH